MGVTFHLQCVSNIPFTVYVTFHLQCVSDEEEVTREEIQEEWDFIDTALETKVMDIARDFLISKGSYADQTANDVNAGKRRERFMMAVKFIVNIFAFLSTA